MLTGETAAAPVGERSISGPRFPIGLRGAMAAYVANANVNTTLRRVLPGRHILVARDPRASAGDKSSLGSIDELPPATSHGYAEWDFSGVQDPVMFRLFLNAADYWFGYSDDSSAGSYDPARECCVVIANDPANAADVAGAADGEVPPALGTGPRLAAGPSAPPPSPPRGADINAQLAQARELEAKLAEEYRTVRLLRASIAGEASARGERARDWAGKPAIASTPTSTSTIRTRPASKPKAHRRRNTTAGHARPLDARGAEPAPRGAGSHRASGRPTGRKLGVPHPPTGERVGRWGCARPRALGTRGQRS
jgi:hypothetical protein